MPVGVPAGFNAAMTFLGASSAACGLRELVGLVAPIDVTLLLTGESGAGKGVVARAVHAASRRRAGPFVTVSCPVLPRDLLESELFGHERGAFTGALRSHAGAIERATGGTLFLDEVGDLPTELQPKLLTVLQDREYRRVGGSETLRADVRVIAATHANLRERVAARSFREDLFYRLNVVPIRVPPLRERLEDLPTLGAHILARIAASRGTEAASLSAAACEVLSTYAWPGNVRELENVLERATLSAVGGRVRPEDLPGEVHGRGATLGEYDMGGEGVEDTRASSALAGLTLAALERMAVEQTLTACGGNRAATARRLGVSDKTVRAMIRRHCLSGGTG